LFKCQSYEEDMEVAEGCFRWVTNISLRLLLFEFQGFNKIVYFFFQTLEVQNLGTCSDVLTSVYTGEKLWTWLCWLRGSQIVSSVWAVTNVFQWDIY
jgi:hypothetical protein